ncbi:nucleotidyltransferase domain-containing protein [Oceanobacillus kimchii]|uniref:Nucleotidyltransferase n=1 Tax=Oceanobacillus kimchii TaxID=746691 RepID=A0ABQ5TFT8_9BACI|nr:nucleotidyltransferase domain-containing protein [Oceanobacillus kimchii]GLO64556.1 nucleotidyltransferase [Oceanobacillus kimchii]
MKDIRNRMNAREAARKIVEQHFPSCTGAVLAGSVLRGEATNTSDLDIVIFDKKLPASYRTSFNSFGWPVEAFVHNSESYKFFFESDRKRARPSLPDMVANGVIIKNEDGIMDKIKVEANQILTNGPDKWTKEEIDLKRYFLTDVLDDFIGSEYRPEELFILNKLMDLVCEFILRTKNQWVGDSKGMYRALQRHDDTLTEELIRSVDTFYQYNEKKSMIEFVDRILEPYGGRFFEGFLLGKMESAQSKEM